jgi:large subunit ribosomal protein L10
VRKLQKAAIIEDIQSKMARSQIGILTDFTGLKVEDLTRLRRQLQEADGELKVVKNTLMERAVAGDSHMALLQAHFTGPNALTLAYQDPVAVAKILVKFAQEKPQFKIKAGVLGGQLLDAQAIDALSKLPAREVLMAQLLGVLKGVPTALVTVLSGVIRNLLNVLVAIKDQKEPQADEKEPQADEKEPQADEVEPQADEKEPQADPETPEAGETVGDA